MKGQFDGGGRRSRLQDALEYQIDERDIELFGVEETKERTFIERFAGGRTDLWRFEAADVDSVPEAFQRINELQSVLAILRACLPDAKNLASLEQQLIRAAEKVAAAGADGAELDQTDARVQEINADLSSVEKDLLELESKIPLSWLGHQLDERDFGDMALAHYLSFHIRHMLIGPMSMSRIDLLVSRLVSRRDDAGMLVLRPAAEVAELLRECVPEAATQPHVRKAAMLFFRNAGQRLDELERAEDLFDSGFLVDVLGYKLSLRAEYFDARLLYVSAELNIAMENWLVHTHGLTMRSLDPQFAEARERVRRIFSNNAGDDVRALTEQWNREFSGGDARQPRATTAQPQDAAAALAIARAGTLPWRKLIAAAVLLVGLIYVAPTLLDMFRTSQRGLKSIAASELGAISPLLVEGSWAGDAPSRILIGHVEPETWRASKNPERRQAAEVIRDALRHRDVPSALVYMSLGADRTLVVNIMEGEVRYVQPYQP